MRNFLDCVSTRGAGVARDDIAAPVLSAQQAPRTQRFGEALRKQAARDEAPAEATSAGDASFLAEISRTAPPTGASNARATAPSLAGEPLAGAASERATLARVERPNEPASDVGVRAEPPDPQAPALQPSIPPGVARASMSRETTPLLAFGAALSIPAPTPIGVAASQTNGEPIRVGLHRTPLTPTAAHGATIDRIAVGANERAALIAPTAHRAELREVAWTESAVRVGTHALELQTAPVPARGADVVFPGGAPSSLDANVHAPAAFRAPLAHALGERLHVQIAQRSEHASIRLDPPSMGSIEVVVRHEAGAVHVQLRATNAEVARQLQGLCETLRQDLAQRHQGEVSVQVWDASRDGEGREQRQRDAAPWREDAPGRALHSADGEAAFALAQD
jgi:flagellar hook-length control protein FliK